MTQQNVCNFQHNSWIFPGETNLSEKSIEYIYWCFKNIYNSYNKARNRFYTQMEQKGKFQVFPPN